MKRGFKKSLALLLAMFLTFGAIPFCAIGMIASAADPTLVDLSISDDSITLQENETFPLTAIAFYSDNTHKTLKTGVRWSSENDTYVSVSSAGVVTAKKLTTTPVTVFANYTENGIAKEASCKVIVTKAPVPVTLIQWNWDVTALLADTSKEYSFADKFKVYPDNADDKTATLTCAPEGALQIDNEKKTFKVNPISSDKLVVTLTLTANGASAQCQSAIKQITVYDDVPLTSVEWDYKVGSTGRSLFKFYESISGIPTPAEYYYEITNGKETTRKYHTTPSSAVDLCEITVSSSDKRVIRFDEPTKRLIPVGNGEARITVTARTPKGVVKSHTIIAVVQDSPYTPVTTLGIGYDADNTDSDAEYDKDSNTIKLMYLHSIKLNGVPNQGAKLDQKAISLNMTDGRKLKIVDDVIVTWKSSDEDVATVDKNGNVKVTGPGTATIKLTVEDNGEIFTKEVKIKGTITWWQALVGIIISFITGRWNRIPKFFSGLFSAFG